MIFEIKKLFDLANASVEYTIETLFDYIAIQLYFANEQTTLCAEGQTCFSYRCKKDQRLKTKNPTNRKKEKMRTYDELLQAVIRYINKHGKTQSVIDKVETMLPAAWSANIIADALDEIASR